MEKLFLLDAYALIYRAYYAFINSPRINSRGENTGAVLGFVNTLVEIIKKEKPTYIAAAFDHGLTFRHSASADYKAQREATPEDIHRAVPIIKELLGAWGIACFEAEGFEADDIIGTIAKAPLGDVEVYMVTGDKDYCQLVDERVRLFRPRHGGGYETLGPAEVCAKYGIKRPGQVVDLLALMGDSADNYPGCKGIGPKGAAALIAEWDSVDNLLSHLDAVEGAAGRKLREHEADVRLSLFLARIRTDVPGFSGLDVETLRLREPDMARLGAAFEELEFRSLAEKVEGLYVKKVQKQQKAANREPSLFDEIEGDGTEASENARDLGVATTPHKYHLVDNEEEARALCEKLLTFPTLCFDTETTSKDAMRAKLVGVSLAVEEGEAWYCSDAGLTPDAQGRMSRGLLEALRPLLESAASVKVGQNMKYDIEVLRRHGVEVGGAKRDTMVAHYLLWPEQRHGMDYQAETLLGYRTIHYDDVVPKGKTMGDLSPTLVRDYASEDADVTLRLWHALEPRLRGQEGLWPLFEDVEMPLVDVLCDMELEGVAIDSAALGEVSRLFTERMAGHEARVWELAGQRFNLNSPRQVGEVLFGQMKIIEKPKRTKTGQYVTSEEVLAALAPEHEVVSELLAYRSLKKLVGTYVDALPQLVNAETGRIHTSFNQCVTATGRLSSSDPNLQNIPVRGADGKEIRRCFIAPLGGALFFSADYSQIELRVMAHMSGDAAMIAAYRNGSDIHATTAALVYKKAVADVTRDERSKAKRANFGLLYGISAWGLSQSLGIERKEARALMEGFYEAFPGVRLFMETLKERARETGYAETLLRRRRYLPDILSGNATVRSFAERNAVNAPVQGTAADIIKVAMVGVWRRLRAEGLRSRLVLQVHDELCLTVPAEERERVERLVREEMEGAMRLRVPLVADGGFGHNWLEAH